MKTSPTRTVTFFHLRILKFKIQQANMLIPDDQDDDGGGGLLDCDDYMKRRG